MYAHFTNVHSGTIQFGESHQTHTNSHYRTMETVVSNNDHIINYNHVNRSWTVKGVIQHACYRSRWNPCIGTERVCLTSSTSTDLTVSPLLLDWHIAGNLKHLHCSNPQEGSLFCREELSPCVAAPIIFQGHGEHHQPPADELP